MPAFTHAPRSGRRKRLPRVLVAEDDRALRLLVVQALRNDGYEVREAEDGGRLLVQMSAHFRTPNLDLVISDIRMPIACQPRQVVPAILIAAVDDYGRPDVGAIFFRKPFALSDLRAAVKKALRVP
jgi:DNA-binding response OmpR family regulator